MKSSIRGTDYVDMGVKLWSEAKAANGLTVGRSSAEGGFPRLSNGELIALVTAWKRAAARSRMPTWPGWYELTLEALGWHQEGDRFQMTKEHARDRAPDFLVELFWQSMGDLAGQLDAARTVVKPIIIDYSYASYEQAARDAWQKMKAERPAAISPIPPLPDKPPPSPITPPPPPSLPKASGSDILLIVLIIAAWATKKRKG